MGEINWVLSLFIGAILSIPVGVLTNLLTPAIQDKFEKNALSTNKKKLERLKKERNEVKELHDNPLLFSVKTARFTLSGLATIVISIAVILVIMGATIFFSVSSSLNQLKSTLALIIIYIPLLIIEQAQIGNFVKIIIRLLNYEEYIKKVSIQIEELEQNKTDNNKSRSPF